MFARNHNLYMMDAENYAKALKNANDPSIKETQITTDGIEDFGYGGRGGRGGQDQQEQQQHQNQNEQQGRKASSRTTRARVRPVGNVAWSRDSKKFALMRRDSRKMPKLWVINALANPRPTLETYPYAMPGEAERPQAQLEIFDVAAKSRRGRQGGRVQGSAMRWRSDAADARAAGSREDRADMGRSGVGQDLVPAA